MVVAPGTDRAVELEAEVGRLSEENARLLGEVSALRERVEGERMRYKSLWRESCEQLRDNDSAVGEKDAEIEALAERIVMLELRGSRFYVEASPAHLPASSHVAPEVPVSGRAASPRGSHSSGVSTGLPRGKAPPIDSFDGESLEVRFASACSHLEQMERRGNPPPTGRPSPEEGSFGVVNPGGQ